MKSSNKQIFSESYRFNFPFKFSISHSSVKVVNEEELEKYIYSVGRNKRIKEKNKKQKEERSVFSLFLVFHIFFCSITYIRSRSGEKFF